MRLYYIDAADHATGYRWFATEAEAVEAAALNTTRWGTYDFPTDPAQMAAILNGLGQNPRVSRA